VPCSAFFLDASPGRSGWGRSLAFGEPLAVRCAERLAEVPDVIEWACQAGSAGRWAVLLLAYEAAPALDPCLLTHPPGPFPLAFAAAFAGPEGPEGFAGDGGYAASPWRALVPRGEHAAAVRALHECLACGETYQANLTLPFACDFQGDDRAWFLDLAAEQRAGFCAWVDLGRWRALSFSPELFFRLDGRGITARPMKGTRRAAGEPAEDDRLAAELARSPKDRAENVMIVDLLRNDLGRIARAGSVRVPRLFEVERYPCVLQMTSTVTAELAGRAGAAEVLAALFPCGSVTGAPKIRTMEILREIERFPRGLYTGALGLLSPSGKAVFSVPIRTVVLDRQTGRAVFGVGGGITSDSDCAAEYAECLAKLAFLERRDGEFTLLESLLLERGRYPRLAGHLRRLAASAEFFGVDLDLARVRATLDETARGRGRRRCKVRLCVTRRGTVTASAEPVPAAVGLQRLGLARTTVRSDDPLLRHKTTRRAVFEAALAGRPLGCDDVLLVNERGEVTESTRANLVAEIDGALWTPPVSCGLLPGVFRAELLRRGIVAERVLRPEDLGRAGRLWLVNSVRRWMRARLARE